VTFQKNPLAGGFFLVFLSGFFWVFLGGFFWAGFLMPTLKETEGKRKLQENGLGD
jgi:hypothetical protein